MDKKTAGRIKVLLSEDIDWEYTLQKSQEHSVMPLLYYNLNTTFREKVPESALKKLNKYFHANTGWNLLLTGELLKILDTLESNGIKAIPYKGPVLAESAYGSIALRQFGDLDILVHRHDVLKVKNLLIKQKYRPEYQFGTIREKMHLQFDCEYNFDRIKDGIHVEIHWQIVPKYIRFKQDFERLWNQSGLLHFSGKKVRNLSTEDLLLIFSVHNGGKHCWGRIGWICDVAELIRCNQQMNWDSVLNHAARLGSRRMLFTGLLLARDLLGANIPEEVTKKIENYPPVKSIAEQISHRLFYDTEDYSAVKKYFSYFKIRENLRDRIRYIPHILKEAVLPTEKEEALLLLPVVFSFIYYLLRPVRLIIKYLLLSMRKFGYILKKG